MLVERQKRRIYDSDFLDKLPINSGSTEPEWQVVVQLPISALMTLLTV